MDNKSMLGLREVMVQTLEKMVDSGKNVKTVLRTRRENVTEMILEKINDFTRAPYCEEINPADAKDISEVLESARCLENRAVRYYTDASVKMKALSEVARELKRVGKKHTAHLKKLDTL